MTVRCPLCGTLLPVEPRLATVTVYHHQLNFAWHAATVNHVCTMQPQDAP